jgi:transcriptional regulator GlxA family with amidase domain
MRNVPVYVVLPPQLLLLDLAGPLEVLRRANYVQRGVQFEVRYVGPAASMRTSIGVMVTAIEPLPDNLPRGAMVVIAGSADQAMEDWGGGAARLKKKNAGEAAIVAWLRRHIRRGHKLISICSGALLAGRAGLLDGRACTTHYSCCGELAKLAPKAKVLENRLYVQDGECYSSAGITAGIDLMLYVVSQLTDEASALAVARYLVVYIRRRGADPQLSPWLEGRNHIHPAVHRVQDAMISRPAESWTLSKLARLGGASDRHLSRLFHQHAGMSITDYRNRLRVALAGELLSQTQLDMESVAERAGFGSTRQLRRAWRRLHKTAPRQARGRMHA